MATQKLEVGKNETIYIETPGGLIAITRGSGKSRNKVMIELPQDMAAQRGMDRIRGSLRFLTIDDDGNVTPAYKVLTPVLDDDGHLVGVGTPPVRTVAG